MTASHVPQPIASFIAAINSQDHAAFIGAFTTSPFVDDWGTRYDGLQAIQAWSDRELLGAKGTFTVESSSQEGNVVTVVGDWRSSFANGPSSFRFGLEGDKIASMTIRED